MTAIRFLGLLATPAFLGASGAVAQDPIPYDSGEYEYADADVVQAEVGPPQVIFRENPVVQPIPTFDPNEGVEAGAWEWSVRTEGQPVVIHTAPANQLPVFVQAAPSDRTLYVYPAMYAHAPASQGASRVIYQRRVHRTAPGYTYFYEGSAPTLPVGGRIVQFDRNAWLAECRERIAPVTYYQEDGDGEVAGAVIGAVAGGIVGNRVAGRGNRTIGTLAGAGLGALAGAAIGDSVDDRTVVVEDEDRSGECEAYLDGYMESARTGGLHGQRSATGEYMLVPVTVMIPQHAVYSDATPFER